LLEVQFFCSAFALSRAGNDFGYLVCNDSRVVLAWVTKWFRALAPVAVSSPTLVDDGALVCTSVQREIISSASNDGHFLMDLPDCFFSRNQLLVQGLQRSVGAV
jgi:hypothetical protein